MLSKFRAVYLLLCVLVAPLVYETEGDNKTVSPLKVRFEIIIGKKRKASFRRSFKTFLFYCTVKALFLARYSPLPENIDRTLIYAFCLPNKKEKTATKKKKNG